MAYQNGQIPSTDLTYVQGIVYRIYLLTATAVAWKSMRAACKTATGVTLKITSPYGGYRSLKAQFAMWADRYNRVKYPAGVAYPGVSVHGWGRSVDINNWGAAAVWLRDNAGKFGFRRTISNEAWHFEHSGGSSGGGVAPATNQEDNMSAIIGVTKDGKSTWMRLREGGLGIQETTNPTIANRWKLDNGWPTSRKAYTGDTAKTILEGWTTTIATNEAAIARIVAAGIGSGIVVPPLSDEQLAEQAAAVASLVEFPSAEEMAAAVDDALEDNFAAIPGAVREEIIAP